MITIEVNPDGIDDEYLKCLNLGYGQWGDGGQYHWYFQRRTAFPETDLMVMRIDGKIAAGSAVSYRTIALANDQEVTGGIMTGSWTLPEFRGQGCFARLIEESLQVTAKKNGALLLAFVTQENASSRQLARAGAAMFPTSYLISKTPIDAVANSLKHEAQDDSLIKTLFAKFNANRRGLCRFAYPTDRDFLSQFVDRPGTTELLTDGRGNFGIIESKADTDILQLCITDRAEPIVMKDFLAQLLNYSHSRGRKLMFYSTQAAMTAVGIELGFEAKPGYIAALSTQQDSLSEAFGKNEPWNLQSGDRL
jgi:hypothetical protein